MNSHIQMPRFLMKRFKNKNGKVFYLDLETNDIKESTLDELGTEKNYYSDQTEELLNKKTEDKFARFVDRVQRFLEEEEKSITFPIDVENSFRAFIRGATVRSELAKQSFLSNSQVTSLFPLQFSHDWLVHTAINKGSNYMPQLDSYKTVVLINRTDNGFVAPRNCFFEVTSDGTKCICVPVAPKIGFALVPYDTALKYEYAFNKKFVISQEKEQLEDLLQYLNENRNMMDDLREKAAK